MLIKDDGVDFLQRVHIIRFVPRDLENRAAANGNLDTLKGDGKPAQFLRHHIGEVEILQCEEAIGAVYCCECIVLSHIDPSFLTCAPLCGRSPWSAHIH